MRGGYTKMKNKEKQYQMLIPKDAMTMLRFNDCQQAILDLQNTVNLVLAKEQLDKLKEAYDILHMTY